VSNLPGLKVAKAVRAVVTLIETVTERMTDGEHRRFHTRLAEALDELGGDDEEESDEDGEEGEDGDEEEEVPALDEIPHRTRAGRG
jgi:hypothetical protein